MMCMMSMSCLHMQAMSNANKAHDDEQQKMSQ